MTDCATVRCDATYAEDGAPSQRAYLSPKDPVQMALDLCNIPNGIRQF